MVVKLNTNDVSLNLARSQSVSSELESGIDFEKLASGDRIELKRVGSMAALGNQIAMDALLNMSLYGKTDFIRKFSGESLFSAYTNQNTHSLVSNHISRSTFEALEGHRPLDEASPVMALIAEKHCDFCGYQNAHTELASTLKAPMLLESDECLIEKGRMISEGEISSHIDRLRYSHIAVTDLVTSPTKNLIEEAIANGKDYGKDIIVVPLHENKNHFTALVVNVKTEERVYFNSNDNGNNLPDFLTGSVTAACKALQCPADASERSPLGNGCGGFVFALTDMLEQKLETSSSGITSELVNGVVEDLGSLSTQDLENIIYNQRIKVAYSAAQANAELSGDLYQS